MRRSLVLFLTLLLPTLLLAQAPPRRKAAGKEVAAPAAAIPADRLVKVRVSGSSRFTEEEIASASGLKPGTTISDPVVQQATDRLTASGMFSEVAWTSTYTPGRGAVVDFRVRDLQQFVPAVFDNFVWLSREELLKRIAARIPLFRGEIPLAGNMADMVAGAMTAEMRAAGLEGSVRYLHQARLGQDITSVLFTAEGITIPVRAVSFPSASPDLAAVLSERVKPLLQESYRGSRASLFAEKSLLLEFYRRGYLRAAFGEPQARLVGTPPADNSIELELPVDQGMQYRLAEVHWHGNSAYTSQELAKALKVASGQVCDQVQLEEDALAIAKAFGAKGYMAARIDLRLQFNEADRTVVANLHVTEGPQYRMGELTIEGLDPKAAERLRADWTMRTGDVFNSLYTMLFLQAPQRTEYQLRYKLQSVTKPDPANATVAITLRFLPR